jgi:hypothetical protein
MAFSKHHLGFGIAMTRSRSPTATLLNINRHRPKDADVALRLAERDQRETADTRTDAQRCFGDPPVDRSALAHRNVSTIFDSLIFSLGKRR